MPAYIRAMVEKKLLGDKTKGGFYKQGQGRQRSRRSTRRRSSTAPRAATRRSSATSRSSRKIEDPRERVRKLVADAGQGRASSRGRCSRGRSPTRRGASARSPTSVVAIDDAMKWGYNWELGPFETWDALGFDDDRRPHEEGRHRAARVDREDARGGREELLHGRRQGLRPRSRASTSSAATDPRDRDAHRRCARAARPCSRTTAPRRGTSATACSGSRSRPRRTASTPTSSGCSTRRSSKAETRLPRAGRSPTRASTSASGANLFLVVMAAQPEGVGADPRRWCSGYQGAVPADEVRDACRSSPRRTA